MPTGLSLVYGASASVKLTPDQLQTVRAASMGNVGRFARMAALGYIGRGDLLLADDLDAPAPGPRKLELPESAKHREFVRVLLTTAQRAALDASAAERAVSLSGLIRAAMLGAAGGAQAPREGARGRLPGGPFRGGAYARGKPRPKRRRKARKRARKRPKAPKTAPATG
jgi:hypothetical protein